MDGDGPYFWDEFGEHVKPDLSFLVNPDFIIESTGRGFNRHTEWWNRQINQMSDNFEPWYPEIPEQKKEPLPKYITPYQRKQMDNEQTNDQSTLPRKRKLPTHLRRVELSDLPGPTT